MLAGAKPIQLPVAIPFCLQQRGRGRERKGRRTKASTSCHRKHRAAKHVWKRPPKQVEEVFKVLTALVSFLTAVFLHRGLPIFISTVREVRAPEGISPDLVVEPPCRIHAEKGG